MIKKLFGRMLVIQILSAMTVTLCMLVDSIMIGRFLGVDSMTAYGLASPVLLVFAAFGSMIAAGAQVMCGKALGEGNKSRANACYTVSAAVAAAVSVIGVVLVLLRIDPLCTLLGAGENSPANPVYGLTRDYLSGFIVGAPGFIAAQIMVPYMQMSGSRKRLVGSVIAMVISNISLNLLNVLVLHRGTFGMGLASSVSYYIAALIGLPYFFRKDCIFKFRKKYLSLRVLAGLMSDGVPTLINQVSLVLLTFVLNKLLLEVGGNLAVAAYSVIATVGNLCYAFSSGNASVTLTLSSMFYGDKDRPSLRELVRTMIRYGLLTCTAVTVTVLLAADPLVTMFLENAAAKGLAVAGLRLFILSLVPCVLNTSFKNFYQGVEKVRLSLAISVTQNFALIALSAFVLSRFLGVTGVWLGFLCGELLTWLLICVNVFCRNRHITFRATPFMLLDPNFGVSDEHCFEMTVLTANDVDLAAQRAGTFCRAQGLTARGSAVISLCVGEMAQNIVQHGFQPDKDNTIDIRIMVGETETVVRLRDNCKKFDPVKYMELHPDKEEPGKSPHIGIHMVMRHVREAKYVYSLGLNNLTLTIGENTGATKAKEKTRPHGRKKTAHGHTENQD